MGNGGNELVVKAVICCGLNRLLLTYLGPHRSVCRFTFTSIFIFVSFSRGCFFAGSETLFCQVNFTNTGVRGSRNDLSC